MEVLGAGTSAVEPLDELASAGHGRWHFLPAVRSAVHSFRALQNAALEPYTKFSYRLVRTLQQNPATEDFVYLRRAKRQPADVNPYALQVTHSPGVSRSLASQAAAGAGVLCTDLADEYHCRTCVRTC